MQSKLTFYSLSKKEIWITKLVSIIGQAGPLVHELEGCINSYVKPMAEM